MTEQPSTEPQTEVVDHITEARNVFTSWGDGKLSFEDALQRLNEILVIITEDRPSDYGTVENLKGIMLGQRGNFNEAAQVFEKAAARLVANNDFSRAASTTLNLGETYRFQGKFAPAQDAYRKCYNMALSINDLFRQGVALVHESRVLLRLKKLDRAEYVAKEGMTCLEKSLAGGTVPHNFTSIESDFHGIMTLIAIEQQDMDKAWLHATKSLKNALDNGGALVEATAYRVIGILINRSPQVPDGFVPDAAYYFAKAIEIFEAAKVDTELGMTLMSHAEGLIQRGKTEEALPILKRAIEMFTKMNMVGDLLEARMLHARHARS